MTDGGAGGLGGRVAVVTGSARHIGQCLHVNGGMYVGRA